MPIVHVLVQTGDKLFFVGGEIHSIDETHWAIDPLVLENPQFLSPPLPLGANTIPIPVRPIKTMTIRQANVVLVVLIDEEKENDASKSPESSE